MIYLWRGVIVATYSFLAIIGFVILLLKLSENNKKRRIESERMEAIEKENKYLSNELLHEVVEYKIENNQVDVKDFSAFNGYFNIRIIKDDYSFYFTHSFTCRDVADGYSGIWDGAGVHLNEISLVYIMYNREAKGSLHKSASYYIVQDERNLVHQINITNELKRRELIEYFKKMNITVIEKNEEDLDVHEDKLIYLCKKNQPRWFIDTSHSYDW